MERQPSRSRVQTQGGHSPRVGSATAVGRSRGEHEGSRLHTTNRKSRAHKTSSDPGSEATCSPARTMPNHTKGGGKLAPPATVVGAPSVDRSKTPTQSRERASPTASATRASPSGQTPTKEVRRKSRNVSRTSPQSGGGKHAVGREEIPEACFWESGNQVEARPEINNHENREVLSYAQRRATVLAEQRYRESISYSNRRATQMAVAEATARATGEEPKYLSYGEYRKSMSYATRREERIRNSASATSPTPSPGGLTSPNTTNGSSQSSTTAVRRLQPPPDERLAARSTSPSPRGDKSPREDKSPRGHGQDLSQRGSNMRGPQASTAKATPQPKRTLSQPPVAVSATAKAATKLGSQSSPGSRPYRPPPRVQESSDSEEEVRVPVPKKKAGAAPPNGMRMF